MALDLVVFEKTPVTLMTVRNAPRFMARLVTSDVSKMLTGALERTVLMNATGGVIDTLWVGRSAQEEYRLILAGENADAREAWIRQVRVAFDAEVDSEKCDGFYFVGKLPVDGLTLEPGHMVEMNGITFLCMNWVSLVVGPSENIEALRNNLIAAGAKTGEQTGLDALRILAREPALGLEFDESASPLETGLEDALDFTDKDRIFIGRALTEARANAGNHDKLQLVAFDTPFDPSLLIDVPLIAIGDLGYQLTSIARIPEIPLTVGLVRLPASVNVGDRLKSIVQTDPRTVCEGAIVIDPQI